MGPLEVRKVHSGFRVWGLGVSEVDKGLGGGCFRLWMLQGAAITDPEGWILEREDFRNLDVGREGGSCQKIPIVCV